MSIFTHNAMPNVKSSWFPLRPSNTLTLSMPYLTPVLCTDILPGDKWRMQTEIFARMLPLLAPTLAEVDVYLHYFFCPLRLLTDDYDRYFNPEEQDNISRPFIEPSKFVTQLKAFMAANNLVGESGDLTGHYIIDSHPETRSTAEKLVWDLMQLWSESSLADYLGIPVCTLSEVVDTTVDPDWLVIDLFLVFVEKITHFSAYPFLMYQFIYDEYYRDQTLEDSVLESIADDLDGFYKGKVTLDEVFDILSFDAWKGIMSKRSRAWQKDYFTSALPKPQSGPDVHLPLTGDAPVVRTDKVDVVKYVTAEGVTVDQNPVSEHGDYDKVALVHSGKMFQYPFNDDSALPRDNDSAPITIDPNGTLKADMSDVTSATVNELRRAVRAQEFLEKCARGGRRYIEMILSHFGVKSSDGRLDRPEFLGGGRQPFTITEVLSHVGEDDTQNFILGEMGGHGVSYGTSSKTKRFFEEHGFLFAIVSIIPRASYQQGLARMWTRETIFDYAWPSFANLGEQEIYNYEIFAQHSNPKGTFGYAPRYSEYKYLPSSIHGAMRSSLSYWHLGRIFKDQPALNGDFVHPKAEECNRIFAVEDETEDKIVMVVKHHIKAKRRLPKYGIPTL